MVFTYSTCIVKVFVKYSCILEKNTIKAYDGKCDFSIPSSNKSMDSGYLAATKA